MKKKNKGGRKMQPFITQYSNAESKEDWRNQQVMQGIESVNWSIQRGNELMEQYVQSTEKRLQAVERKKRRKRVQDSICVTQDGKIIIVEMYDTGEQIVEPFIMNITGRWDVYRIKFVKTKIREQYFIISFPLSDMYIIGKKSQNSEKGLYDYFVKGGIKFNSRLSKSRIMTALFQGFGPEIENCTKTLCLPELAGWTNRRFMTSEKFPLCTRQDFPNLPILEKHFNPFVSMENIEEYLGMISTISRWENRILMMEIPVWGMMASIFAEEKLKINFCVNMIFLQMQNKWDFSQFVQIFNRDVSEIIEADMNEKKLAEKLSACNDEVIILDACTLLENSYKRRKIRENTEKVKQKVCGGENSLLGIEREIYCSLLIFSEQIQLNNAINVFVDEDFWKKPNEFQEILRGKPIESFIACFIQFAENNLHEVHTIIKNNYIQTPNKCEAILQATWEILQKFWESRGIILGEYLQIPPQIEWSIFSRKIREEDLIRIFIEAVRDDIKYWKTIEKNRNRKYESRSIYYCAEWIMIPNEVFDRILGRHGLLGNKLYILYELKQRGDLRCDQEGLSQRIQIDMQRKEFYCLKRALFKKIGAPDIIDLGRRE